MLFLIVLVLPSGSARLIWSWRTCTAIGRLNANESEAAPPAAVPLRCTKTDPAVAVASYETVFPATLSAAENETCTFQSRLAFPGGVSFTALIAPVGAVASRSAIPDHVSLKLTAPELSVLDESMWALPTPRRAV